MGLFDSLRNELIDIIEWLDDGENNIAHRFERHDNEIKNGAQLIVRESQAAVFFNQGQIADVFRPGRHKLATENIPILSTIMGWKYGFDSPFKAEVVFVNTNEILDCKFGTQSPIMMVDPRFGDIEVTARGSYSYKIVDPGLFVKEVIGTRGQYDTDGKINGQLRNIMVTNFIDAVAETELPISHLARNYREMGDFMLENLNPDLAKYGIELTSFQVLSISMPDEIKKEIMEYSRLDKVDLNKLTQMKAAKALEKAAGNESGTAGAGLGMGMGFAMANQMGGMFNPNQQQTSTSQPAQNQNTGGAGAPPPIPGTKQFFIAVNGQQQGPFPVSQLKTMAAGGSVTKETLVWAEGMAGWEAAGTVAETKGIFGSVPPPIPGM